MNEEKILIGMFHNRIDPNRVSRAYLYSAIAKNEGAEFFYFTSRNVDFQSRKILGKYYEQGEWKEQEFPYPDVIINAANQLTEKQSQVEEQLQAEIPFTSHPVGSKLAVYNRVSKSSVLQPFILPYQEVKNPQDVFLFLQTHTKNVIKPIRGHHGEGLVSIEETNGGYLAKSKDTELYFSKPMLERYLNRFKQKMVMQKFVSCKLKTGEPYDFRVHMQKNKIGKWQITVIVPRVGSTRRVVTNLSQGSQMIEFKSFMRSEFGKEAGNMVKYLEGFAMQFVKQYELLYPYEFDELGIDIGIDENRKIWIYEVNWRPGHVFIEVITAKHAIDYAMYLAKNSKKRERKEELKR